MSGVPHFTTVDAFRKSLKMASRQGADPSDTVTVQFTSKLLVSLPVVFFKAVLQVADNVLLSRTPHCSSRSDSFGGKSVREKYTLAGGFPALILCKQMNVSNNHLAVCYCGLRGDAVALKAGRSRLIPDGVIGNFH